MIYSRIMADEQEIVSDASAVAEGDIGEAGCPVKMGYLDDSAAQRCGRKLHIAPEGVDEETVCLMHSKDSRKQSGPLFEAFWLEFERILEAAGESEAHFEYFVFPRLDLSGRKFQATCLFDDATFTQDAVFSDATFTQDADFIHVTFTKNVNFFDATFTQVAQFDEATFTQDADYRGATFTEDAEFADAIFTQNAHFDSAAFTQDAHFWEATFAQDADFSHATFIYDADFHRATFKQGADFSEATFTQRAHFGGTIFAQEVDFRRAIFMQNAHFSEATFTRDANFTFATFTQAVDFWRTRFHGIADWRGSRFLDQAEFRGTKFNPLVEGEPSTVFALAKFSKPGEIVFEDVDLSRAFFHNCDVSQVWFTSSVRWETRGNNRGLAVFEEKIDLKQKYAEGLQKDGHRDYRAVEQIYHQLQKNYDSRLDYRKANNFHYGEMEMKRLAVPSDGRLLGLRRWLHRKLSLVALYQYASDYGNSYGKPMLWLLGTLVLFAALLPLPGVGLMQQGARQAETYASVWDLQKNYRENLWPEVRLVGKGAITSVDAATFQRSAEYAPAYPWGRVLAILETLLTSSLFALFLLALRRQFRR